MDQYLIPLGTEASLRVPPRTPTGSRSVVSGVWDNVYSRRMMELRRSSRGESDELHVTLLSVLQIRRMAAGPDPRVSYQAVLICL